MKRTIWPHPVARQFSAHVDTLVSARSRSGANNVWRHFSSFFLNLMQEVKIVVAGASDEMSLAHVEGSRYTDLTPEEVVSGRLFGLLPEEATTLIGRTFHGKAKSAIYNAAADLRTFFRWALELHLITLSPDEVASPLDEQDSLPLSQRWLAVTYKNKGTRATRKTQFRLFFLSVAERHGIAIDLGREARAYAALMRRLAAKTEHEKVAVPAETKTALLILPEEDAYAGSLTERLLDHPVESARVFKDSIRSESMVESYLSTVRRFYAWAHDCGLISKPVNI